jgi:hypothetical protein
MPKPCPRVPRMESAEFKKIGSDRESIDVSMDIQLQGVAFGFFANKIWDQRSAAYLLGVVMV